MKGKSIKIKCEKPYGVIVAKESRNYAQYMFSGAQKALIVSDETVFRLYGNGLKKLVKNSGAEVFTFIYPAGENGKTKHVLDKLFILMTELNLNANDCLIAFGGEGVASLTSFACSVFRGGIPFAYIPTTIMGMLNPLNDGNASVDFLGKRDLLKTKNYPIAVICDPDYLISLPAPYKQDGYAEIIRRAMIGDKALIEKMMAEDVLDEEMILSAIKVGLGLKRNAKSRFALNFASSAEKVTGLKVSYGKLVAFGMIKAIETAMALGLNTETEEPMLKLLEKFGISRDVGVHDRDLWNAILSNGAKKYTFVLPKATGVCKVVKLSEEKIKETF